MYRQAGAGKLPLAPGLLAMAALLQAVTLRMHSVNYFDRRIRVRWTRT